MSFSRVFILKFVSIDQKIEDIKSFTTFNRTFVTLLFHYIINMYIYRHFQINSNDWVSLWQRNLIGHSKHIV